MTKTQGWIVIGLLSLLLLVFSCALLGPEMGAFSRGFQNAIPARPWWQRAAGIGVWFVVGGMVFWWRQRKRAEASD